MVLKKKTEEYVNKGDVIAMLYTNKQELIQKAEEIFVSALEFSGTKPQNISLIIDKIY